MIKGIIDDKIDNLEGFNMVYAKRCGRPNNKFFKTRIELVEFLVYNINNMDFLSINDVIVDRNKLVNQSKSLSRYLKIMKINEV